KQPSTLLVAHQAVAAGDVAVDLDRVPFLGVADIVDRHVVMLAPEERHVVERRAFAEHVKSSGLALALGNHPVLDTDALPRNRIGPARDIAGGKDAGDAGFETFVDADTAVEGKAG